MIAFFLMARCINTLYDFLSQRLKIEGLGFRAIINKYDVIFVLRATIQQSENEGKRLECPICLHSKHLSKTFIEYTNL